MEFESPKKLVTKSKVEVMATLQCKYYRNDEWKIRKCYHGKSSRRVNRKQNPDEVLRQISKNKEESTKEAETAALEKCFRERLGFTEFNDFVVDELHRPINA